MTLTWTTCMILLITSVSCFWGLIALFSFVFVWSFVFVAVFSSFVLHCIFLLNIITQLVGMIVCIKSFFFCLTGSTLKRLCLGKERGSSM